ncbi:putative leader peptide [Streptomyces sp. JW3]|uniref:putative leader peptide n=1 Tax=Streptomyces sp. JW3 TaxID=3456955 RepID=UPI003FA4A75B
MRSSVSAVVRDVNAAPWPGRTRQPALRPRSPAGPRGLRETGTPGLIKALGIAKTTARQFRAPGPGEVTDVAHAARAVHLYSRPHIDLQRVAGALCRS